MVFRVEVHFLLLLVLVTCFDISFCNDAVQYRLFNDTTPEHYDIKISTKLEKDGFWFSGFCTITIKVLQETNEIVLHSKLSDIRGVEVIPLFPTTTNITGEFRKIKENEFLIVALKQKVNKGVSLNLKIWYTSKLRTDKLGFYRSSYVNEFGKKVWLAATQFAATEARHAFPCYDEPNRKATFQLEIRHPATLKAISNTDSSGIINYADDTKITQFHKTEKLSTYQLGFFISDFKNLEITLPGSNLNFEIYGVPHKIFDLYSSAVFSIDHYKNFVNYFGISFPVYAKTFRQVAIPDFYFSGMENWALIMYRENMFLYKQRSHSELSKIRSITLTAHEMAHCWFGNLVTMDWWTYVWLNEGFASLYAYYGAQMAYPEYDFMELFVVQQMNPALAFDGTISTRQMSNYVEKQIDIMSSYDIIAYEKAASVLRMWENAFGSQNFKKAIDLYLQENKFKNVDENYLINALSHAMPNVSLQEINYTIKIWTSQKGYPVLTVTRDYNTSSITVTQERFINQGDVDRVTLWRIPINFERENTNGGFNDTTVDIWMDQRTLKLKGMVDNKKNITVGPKEWIIFNKQQTGFYRVNYDEKNWDLIIQALKKKHTYIHVLNRAQLIGDAFALAESGRLNYTIPLKLIGYMSEEISYAPWAILKSNFLELKRHLQGSDSYTLLINYIGKLAEKGIKNDRFDYKNIDAPMVKLSYEIVSNFFCEYNAKNCPFDESSIWQYPGLRFTYYCNRMNLMEKKTFLEIEKLLREEEDYHIRQDLLSALGCSKNEIQLSFILSSTIEIPSNLKLTEFEREFLLKSIYQSSTRGLNITMQFISTEWKSIEYILPHSLDKILPDLAKYINTLELKEMFEQMVSHIDGKINILTTARSLITNNLRWNILYKRDVDEFLNSTSPYHYISLWAIILVLVRFII